MITIDKVTYRNLQEQVLKNKEDIAAWQNVEFTLNNFGIRVLGKVDSESDIPTGTYYYGDAFLVGLTDPYNLYIYTRNKEAADSGSFVNVGPLNVIGQEGPEGPQGPAGVDGYSPVVRYGNGLPIVESTDKDGYLYIDQQTSRLYTFKNNAWNYVVNMQGAKGDKGEQGIQGATGTTLSIVARLASPDLLPTNFASGAIPKNSAYLVDVNGANHLYIILGNQSDYSTWYWADAGDFNLGSVLYKDSVFQQYANITDSYDTNTGAVVTDIATSKLKEYIETNYPVQTLIDTTSASPITLADNTSFRLGEITTLTINNATSYPLDFMCEVVFKSGTGFSMDYSALAITFSGDDCDAGVFTPSDAKTYNILFFNNSNNATASLQAIVRGV